MANEWPQEANQRQPTSSDPKGKLCNIRMMANIPIRITTRTYRTRLTKRNTGNLLPVTFSDRIELNNGQSIPVKITERKKFSSNNNVRAHYVNNCIRIHPKNSQRPLESNKAVPNIVLLNARSLVNPLANGADRRSGVTRNS